MRKFFLALTYHHKKTMIEFSIQSNVAEYA